MATAECVGALRLLGGNRLGCIRSDWVRFDSIRFRFDRVRKRESTESKAMTTVRGCASRLWGWMDSIGFDWIRIGSDWAEDGK